MGLAFYMPQLRYGYTPFKARLCAQGGSAMSTPVPFINILVKNSTLYSAIQNRQVDSVFFFSVFPFYQFRFLNDSAFIFPPFGQAIRRCSICRVGFRMEGIKDQRYLQCNGSHSRLLSFLLACVSKHDVFPPT